MVAIGNKTGGFVCRIGVDDTAKLHFASLGLYDFALVGHNSHRPTVNSGITRDEGLSVTVLVGFEFGIIHQSADDFHHVVGLVAGLGHNTVDVFFFQSGFFGLDSAKSSLVVIANLVHNVFYFVQSVFVVFGLVIGHSRNFAMGRGAAQGFVVDVFANGRLDQITTRQENASRFVHDQGFVAHNGKIGTSGHTTSHDGRNLGNAHAAHQGIVSEDASKMFLVRENFVLQRQINPGRIDQIDDWNPIFHRNFLRSQVFLCCNRKPGSRFHGGIIGHNNALFSLDVPYFHDHAARWTTTVFLVHSFSNKSPNFNAFSFVQQIINAFPRRHFTFGM